MASDPDENPARRAASYTLGLALTMEAPFTGSIADQFWIGIAVLLPGRLVLRGPG